MSASAPCDVLIVGAGVAGALIAERLAAAGMNVRILEAGPATAQHYDGYQTNLQQFYAASAKGPESPWTPAVAARQPDLADLKGANPYFVQRGPQLYGSTYTRRWGGSTLHWLGVSLRMLPEDFAMRTRHGVARDWPLAYATLAPYYARAEEALGVSADVAEQGYHGITFADGYDYPMHRVPPSFSDKTLAARVDGLSVRVGDDDIALKVRGYPAARNSTPRGGYAPRGAVDLRDDGTMVERYVGARCAGNTACTPICPIQAKYHAGKTLARAIGAGLTITAQAVASEIRFDPEDGRVSGVVYKRYDDPASATHTTEVATARVYILAAHAVENAKLMLASGMTAPTLGRGLMDHPALYAWGLSPEAVGAFRGPLSTSGIEECRGGAFRARHAAFRFDIGNDGWRAPAGAPDTTVLEAVMTRRLAGRALRDDLAASLPRQVRLSLAVEQLPDRDNRVSIDPLYRDAVGNPRPVIDYRIDDYTLAGMAAAAAVGRQIFTKAEIEDRTTDIGSNFPSVAYQGRTVHYHGMGHFAGTHTMGDSPSVSVVDKDQRVWGHPNLFAVGSGSFTTMGTSNPTLTIAALALRTADHLLEAGLD